MAGARFPAIKARFVLPLVVLASHDHRILYPDAALGYFETCFPERGTEVLPFTVGMENIIRAARLENGKHDGEHLLEEGGKQIIFHRVVLDRKFIFSTAFVVDIIRRIRNT